MDTSRKREWGGARWRYGIKRYKLLCIKKIRNKDILHSTGNYSHYFVITLNGVPSIKISIHYIAYLKKKGEFSLWNQTDSVLTLAQVSVVRQ